MNSFGFFVTSAIFFPERERSRRSSKDPEGTVSMISSGGFINNELFLLMAETLLKTCQTNRI
jgi:hypothetical protein